MVLCERVLLLTMFTRRTGARSGGMAQTIFKFYLWPGISSRRACLHSNNRRSSRCVHEAVTRRAHKAPGAAPVVAVQARAAAADLRPEVKVENCLAILPLLAPVPLVSFVRSRTNSWDLPLRQPNPNCRSALHMRNAILRAWHVSPAVRPPTLLTHVKNKCIYAARMGLDVPLSSGRADPRFTAPRA